MNDNMIFVEGAELTDYMEYCVYDSWLTCSETAKDQKAQAAKVNYGQRPELEPDGAKQLTMLQMDFVENFFYDMPSFLADKGEIMLTLVVTKRRRLTQCVFVTGSACCCTVDLKLKAVATEERGNIFAVGTVQAVRMQEAAELPDVEFGFLKPGTELAVFGRPTLYRVGGKQVFSGEEVKQFIDEASGGAADDEVVGPELLRQIEFKLQGRIVAICQPEVELDRETSWKAMVDLMACSRKQLALQSMACVVQMPRSAFQTEYAEMPIHQLTELHPLVEDWDARNERARRVVTYSDMLEQYLLQ